MKKISFSGAQIIGVLREQEAGAATKDGDTSGNLLAKALGS